MGRVTSRLYTISNFMLHNFNNVAFLNICIFCVFTIFMLLNIIKKG